jgi:hypothetical protein
MFTVFFTAVSNNERKIVAKSRTVQHSMKLLGIQQYDRTRTPKPGVAGSSPATPANISNGLADLKARSASTMKRPGA